MTKRIIICLLITAILIPALFSCQKDENNEAEIKTMPQSEDSGKHDGLLVSELSQYNIIFPTGNVGNALYRELVNLQKLFETRFGIKVSIIDDYLAKDQSPGEYEILIGNTNRSESQSVMARQSKTKDYEICICERKLVLAGLTDEILTEAVHTLCQTISESGAIYFFECSMQLKVQGSYELDTPTINGLNLSDFTVVYENNDISHRLAKELAELVEMRSGYLLPLITASKADKNAKNYILIGNTGFPLPEEWTDGKVTDRYYAGMSNGNLYLYGADTPAACKAVKAFRTAFSAVSGASPDTLVNDGLVLSADTSMTAMSFNLLVNNVTEERVDRVVKMIKKHMPDSFGVQEASGAWMNALNTALGNDYLYVGISRDGNSKGEHSAVFYRKDRFSLVDSGTKWLSDTPDKVSKVEGSAYNRILSYAILERKSDGAKWMHINLHTDHLSNGGKVRLEQVKILMKFVAQYPDIPMLISGDFNDVESSDSIQHILSCEMDDSSKVAYNAQTAPTFSNKVIDFIFISHGDFVVYDYIVDTSTIDGALPSDHRPVIIRYDLNI